MSITLFLLFLAATFAAGATGALFPTGEWYKRLNKPAWTPPNWAFPVMWTTIYLLIAYAGARLALLPGNAFAMGFWALQIALNALWTPVFFGLRRLKGSLPIMAALWLAVAGATVTHFQLDFWAGLAFVPYLLWVTVAGALNYTVMRLNPDERPLDIANLP
nr:TspO/MBR family protein [Loktanella fryxellensis]